MHPEQGTQRREPAVIWFIAFAVLVIVAVTALLMSRRRHAHADPGRASRFNPSDVRARVELREFSGDSFRSGIRKDPGSRNH